MKSVHRNIRAPLGHVLLKSWHVLREVYGYVLFEGVLRVGLNEAQKERQHWGCQSILTHTHSLESHVDAPIQRTLLLDTWGWDFEGTILEVGLNRHHKESTILRVPYFETSYTPGVLAPFRSKNHVQSQTPDL